MIILDLKKDPILILLLKNMVRAASRISIHDQKLNQKVEELNFIINNPVHVNYADVIGVVTNLAEIVKSYEKTHHVDEKEVGSDLASLPTVIFNFIEKLDELKTKSYLDHKYFSLAELEQRINNFCKLAGK